MEFVRIIYGGPGSKIVIVVLYVCQACGWAPQYDYYYYYYYVVLGKGCPQIWYCAQCGEMYDKFAMNGAFSFMFNDNCSGDSFHYRIRMPDGKFSNFIHFFFFLPNLTPPNY